MGAMLEIFLKLSALADRDHLLNSLLDSLCTSTGAKRGLILLQPQDESSL